MTQTQQRKLNRQTSRKVWMASWIRFAIGAFLGILWIVAVQFAVTNLFEGTEIKEITIEGKRALYVLYAFAASSFIACGVMVARLRFWLFSLLASTFGIWTYLNFTQIGYQINLEMSSANAEWVYFAVVGWLALSVSVHVFDTISMAVYGTIRFIKNRS